MDRLEMMEYLRLLNEELSTMLNVTQELRALVLAIGHVELRRFIIRITFAIRCIDALFTIYRASGFYSHTLGNHYNRFRAELVNFLYEILRQNSFGRQIHVNFLNRCIQRAIAMQNGVSNEINWLS